MTFPPSIRIKPTPCTLCGKTRPLGSTGCNRDQCPIRNQWNQAQRYQMDAQNATKRTQTAAALDELVRITEELGLYEMEAEELANKGKM